MTKDEFVEKLRIGGDLVPKRCTDSYLSKHGLDVQLDQLVPKSFGTTKERIYHVVYGGGYCLTCGVRTSINPKGRGFTNYCKQHFHDPKKGKVAKNKKEIPPKEELEDLYFNKNLSIVDITKHYGNVSNVTVSKWFDHHNIQRHTHSETIIKKAIPKTSETCMERYGATTFFASEEGKRKVSSAFMERYGVHYHPIENPSKAELDVKEFFNSVVRSLMNDETQSFETNKTEVGMELDGFHKATMTAFEYHGLYWHTEDRKEASLHYRKYKACHEKGIRLFSIYSNEWVNRQEQVKNYIKAAMGLFHTKVYARNLKTTTKKLKGGDDKKVVEFFDNVHIQGCPNLNTTKEVYCLEDLEGNIISAISIGAHPRYSEVMCITRLATLPGYKVIGGFRKLLHRILQNYNSLTTWSDNRWSNGEVYQRSGFELIKETRQDYSYTNGRDVIPKQAMRKRAIGAPENMTEAEFVKQEFGFSRIWDCGKRTWRITNT